MRKVKNKETGQIFDSIVQAIHTAHCYHNKCPLQCPLAWIVPMVPNWEKCTAYINQHQNEVVKLFGYEFIDEDLSENNLLIPYKHNYIGEHLSNISDEELCVIFKEIAEYRQEGILNGNSLRDLAKVYADVLQTSVSECIRLTEDAVLFEMSRRFHNILVK